MRVQERPLPAAPGTETISGTRVPISNSEPAFDHFPFFTKLIAVVSKKDDNRIFAQAQTVQFPPARGPRSSPSRKWQQCTRK